jgi:hypothetical protein
VLVLWKAKMLDFDTSCYFDNPCLAVAGVEATLRFLEQQGTEEALDVFAAIESYRDGGWFDQMDQFMVRNLAYQVLTKIEADPPRD